jgi:hypothetical protein
MQAVDLIPDDVWKLIIQKNDDVVMSWTNKHLRRVYKSAMHERMRRIRLLVDAYNDEQSSICTVNPTFYRVMDHTVALLLIPKAPFDYRGTAKYHTFSSMAIALTFPTGFAEKVKVDAALKECKFAGVTLFPNQAFGMPSLPHHIADGHVDNALGLFNKYLPAPYTRSGMRREIAKVYLMLAQTYQS